MASLFALFLIGCGGGGGCSSCAGVEPLPGGFDTSKAVENAGSARITSKGFTWLNDPANLAAIVGNLFGATGGVLEYPIPESSGSAGVDYTICPGGPMANGDCVAKIDFANAALQIVPGSPHEILISGPLPVHLKLPIQIDGGFLGSCNVFAGLEAASSGCPIDETFATLNLTVDISIEVDQNQSHQARFGYTRIHIANVDVPSDDINNALQICDDGSFGCSVIASIGGNDTIKGWILDAFHDTLIGFLQGQLDAQLCQKSNPALTPTCPTGTTDVDGTCRYGTDASADCVSLELGTDGHANLGALLASLSPGTSGGLDFMFAGGGSGMSPDGLAWGDLDPKAGGATIGLLGGAEPNPLSKCVKMSDLARPMSIPVPTALYDENIPGWPATDPGPHVGLALSERFTNYAMAGLYNSGLLCIGLTSEQVPALNSGLLGILSTSLAQLGIQSEKQQVGIVIRPNTAPVVAFGNGTDPDTDPTMRVALKQASFDFYIFSLDRFIRFMTATYDLDVPVTLSVGPMGLTPMVGKLGVTNGVVTNSQLLPDDPAQLATGVGSVLNSAVGTALGGGIAPIDYNSALSGLGLSLFIPESVDGAGSPGIRKLTEQNDNYLGIFASFELGAQQMLRRVSIETSASLTSKTVEAEGLRVRTIRTGNGPRVVVDVASPSEAAKPVEYTYRVDHGFWHPFSRRRVLDLRDDAFRLQGHHTLQVSARTIGEPLSLDTTPAEVAFIIDIDAPSVKLKDLGDGKVSVTVRDAVSDEDHTLVRTRVGGDWSAWQPASAVREIAVTKSGLLEAEAKDEEGNVGTARQALLRGRGDGVVAGCGCEVAGGESDGAPRGTAWLLAAAAAAVVARVGRRRRTTPTPPAAGPSSPSRAAGRTVRALSALATLSLAFSWAGCSCGDDSQAAATTSGSHPDGCEPPDCKALEPGLIGAYTSVAVDGATLWVSGYAEANYEEGHAWGDLVVGKWNGTKVDWDSVDGVPDVPPADNKDPKGYRGGVTDSGDDVGIWTSIALDDGGKPAVAYYDRANKALKFAQLSGSAWTVHTVDSAANAQVGRYAKMLRVGGSWTIVYQWLGAGGDQGAALSKVRVATASTDAPTSGSWAFEDAATDKDSPCRVDFCTGGTVCDAASLRCVTPKTSCQPACATGTACLDDGAGAAACAAVLDATRIDAYPDAIGGYIAIAPTSDGGVGIAYYDRTHGNLWAAAKTGGAWKTHLVDGEAPTGENTSDVGIGASLFIDAAGAWHLTYVDGITESLKYTKLNAQFAIVDGPETVDDGVTLNGVRNEDGQHLIGDDSNVFVTASGDVHVSYQDATSGVLRYAHGVATSSAHNWAVSPVQQDGFAGAFSHVVNLDGKIQIVNWWRKGGAYATGDVSVVTP